MTAANLDWKAALGYLKSIRERILRRATAIYDHCSFGLIRSNVDWQLRGNDSLFLSITHGLLLRGTRRRFETNGRFRVIGGVAGKFPETFSPQSGEEEML